jgi:hypothetical protein
MSLGLTRNMLMVAGRLLVLAYLICVLSPGVAIALGHASAPCLDESVVTISHHETRMTDDATAHHQMHEAHAHHQGHLATNDSRQAQPPAPVPSHHDHAKLPGPCCAMMCAVGLTASLPAVTMPSRVATASETSRETRLPGRTPPRLDRPPIVLI